MIRYIRYIVLVLVCLLVAGCATFKPWSSQQTYQGKGGTFHKVGDMDVWDYGEPDRPYRIIGVIKYVSPITGGIFLVFNLLTMNDMLVDTAKQQGADGIMILSDSQDYVGKSEAGISRVSLKKVVVAIKYVTKEPEKQGEQSSFAGNWAGTFKDLVNQQSGSLSVTVSKDNKAVGSIYNSTIGVSGSVSGTISNTGIASMTYTYPGAVYTANGIMRIDGAGHLVGNFNAYSGNTLFGTVIIDFINQHVPNEPIAPANTVPTIKSLEELKSNWTEEDRYAFDLGIAARLGGYAAYLDNFGGHMLSKSSHETFIDSDFDSYKDSPEKFRGLHEAFELTYADIISPGGGKEPELSDNLKKILSGASLLLFDMGQAYESGFINALLDKIPMIPRSERETGNYPFTRYKNDTATREQLHRAYEWGYLECQMERREAR